MSAPTQDSGTDLRHRAGCDTWSPPDRSRCQRTRDCYHHDAGHDHSSSHHHRHHWPESSTTAPSQPSTTALPLPTARKTSSTAARHGSWSWPAATHPTTRCWPKRFLAAEDAGYTTGATDCDAGAAEALGQPDGNLDRECLLRERGRRPCRSSRFRGTWSQRGGGAGDRRSASTELQLPLSEKCIQSLSELQFPPQPQPISAKDSVATSPGMIIPTRTSSRST